MGNKPQGKKLVLLLGDQLSPWSHFWKEYVKADHCILMAEVRSETDYAPHHKQKLVLTLAAMRKTAQTLIAQGIHVRYTHITDVENSHSIEGEIKRAISEEGSSSFIALEPGEYRLKRTLSKTIESLAVPGEMVEDERFLCTHDDFKEWAEGRKLLTMEYFYRDMRKKNRLPDGERPSATSPVEF